MVAVEREAEGYEALLHDPDFHSARFAEIPALVEKLDAAKAKAASKPPVRRHPRRFTMALEVRLGEKRLLDDILDDIRAYVARESP